MDAARGAARLAGARAGSRRSRWTARLLGAAAACAALSTLSSGTALADDDAASGAVIFARGSALYRVDANGRGETEIAQLPTKVTVRALRTDAAGRVLLADLAGRWAWMPLDGATRALSDLPCADGPAQLAEDGGSVVCRAAPAANQSIVVELVGRKPAGSAAEWQRGPIDVPPTTARIAGAGAERALVWADTAGVWTAPLANPKRKTRLAPDAPLRGFLPSPAGDRAVGVYADQAYRDARHTEPAELLMTVQLDGRGARRKAIRDGVAVEWSHDAQWLLVQDGASACIMRATGGQYKCWKGYTAAALSSDGRWGLVLGNRDGAKKPSAKDKSRSAKADKAARADKPSKPAKPAKPVASAASQSSQTMAWDEIDETRSEPTNEAEAGEARDEPDDDVSVAPPSGPLSLFRVRLDGAFTDRPTLLVKIVDGAAVWVP